MIWLFILFCFITFTFRAFVVSHQNDLIKIEEDNFKSKFSKDVLREEVDIEYFVFLSWLFGVLSIIAFIKI